MRSRSSFRNILLRATMYNNNNNNNNNVTNCRAPIPRLYRNIQIKKMS